MASKFDLLLHSYSDSKSLKKIMKRHNNYSTFHDKYYQQINPNELSSTNDEHCHSLVDSDSVDRTARRKLIIASVLCLAFMIGEIVGGSLANSLAIMTDAAHLLSDFASFMISLFALYLASRPATKRMSFGWHRAEVVGALVSVLLIWVVTGILVYMAVLRTISLDFEIQPNAMLITSGLGVIVNVIMASSLHQHSHGHSHGNKSHNVTIVESTNEEDLEAAAATTNDNVAATKNNELEASGTSSSSTSKITANIHVNDELQQQQHDDDEELDVLVPSQIKRKPNQVNINVRAAFIHVIGDLVQSIGVLIAAFIIYFKPEYKLADPICTFVFSVLVLFTTINILRDTMNVLMEGTPRSLDFDEVKHSLLGLDGVCLLHNLRIWSLTMNKTALSVHLAIYEKRDVQEVLREATKLLLDKFDISDATIQVEKYVNEMNDCAKCQGPDK